MRTSVRMAETSLDEDYNHSWWLKEWLVMQVIKEMVDSSSKARNPKIPFMYLIARRTRCPSRKWKSKITGWNLSMERYVFENRFFKDVFEFRVVSSCRKSIGDHVHWHIAPEVWESNGDSDAWIQKEHESTCLKQNSPGVVWEDW